MRPTINSDAEPERLEEIVVKKDEDVERALYMYTVLLAINGFNEYNGNPIYDNSLLKKLDEKDILPQLSPAQIDLVLQQLRRGEDVNYYRFDAIHPVAKYLSYFIQKSYENQQNGFILHTKDTKIKGLFTMLHGTKKRPLEITLHGVIGSNCLTHSNYIHATIDGNVEHSIAPWATWLSNSTVTVHGSLDENPDPGQFFYQTHNCIFQTTNKKTYETICKLTTHSNTSILLDASGNEIKCYAPD